jgi:hypothetical protein
MPRFAAFQGKRRTIGRPADFVTFLRGARTIS